MDTNWSCVILIGLCLRFVESTMLQQHHYHHQQPYHSKALVHGNDIRLIAFHDGEYKPAAGEILAKDSILYSQKPETRLLRRQLWPIMQDTMDTLVDSVSAGANLFKNMLATNSNPIATKIRNIKNAYISSVVPHKKFIKFAPMKTVKKVKKYPESHRTKTVSEDYVHTYNDETYTVPTYVTKSTSKNPYAQMGLKDYKHFEETVLRELEEKEERKVEEAMGSSHKTKAKDIEKELVQGGHFDGWIPVRPNHDVQTQANYQPKEVGKLHTSFVASNHRPVHQADESRTVSQLHESVIEQPTTTKLRRRKPNSSRTTTSTTTVSPTQQEQPNYPDYFLKKQKGVQKTNQNAQDMSQELNYIKRMKFYREQMQGITALPTSTTYRPPSARDSLLNGASEEQFVFITPLPKPSTDRKMNRQKAVDGKNYEKSNSKNRGTIKFGDSV